MGTTTTTTTTTTTATDDMIEVAAGAMRGASLGLGQPSQNRPIAATGSCTLAKSPRRSAWRSMIAKNTSTKELAVSVPGVAGVGDPAGGDLQRGEQGGGPVPEVVMGAPLGPAKAPALLPDRSHTGGPPT